MAQGSSPIEGPTSSQVLQQAGQLFRHADYKQAENVLRREIMKLGNNARSKIWNRYRQALLARAGDDYLSTVPKDRYRVPVAIFGSDYNKEGIARYFLGIAKYFLLDVRQTAEFAKSHIAGSLNVPFRQVLRHLDWLPKPGTNKVLLIICRSQHRANHVLVILRELGYTNAYTLRGGYHAYQRWLKKRPKSRGTVSDAEEDFGC